uniref:Uncharacterized protein n=1 Tax=Mus spicilegus TaxID=10103 RepID=A0A8C6IKG7_MUSSI
MAILDCFKVRVPFDAPAPIMSLSLTSAKQVLYPCADWRSVNLTEESAAQEKPTLPPSRAAAGADYF